MENNNNNNRERIFFGTIKPQDRTIIAQNNNNISSQGEVEVIKFSEHVKKRQEKYDSGLSQIEKVKKSKNISVPTIDLHVKLKLRELGQPICYFGEGPAERRHRLKEVMIEKGETDGTPLQLLIEEKRTLPPSDESETFYTEGSQPLYDARVFIAKFSMERAKARIAKQREFDIEIKKRAEALTLGQLPETSLMEDEVIKEVLRRAEERDKLADTLKTFTNISSQNGDERVLSACSFQPTSPSSEPKLIATCSWTGVCKLWCCDTFSDLQTFSGHTERATDIKFHPSLQNQSSETAVQFASASADCTIKFWNQSSKSAIKTLEGHVHRVNRIGFHPSGNYIGTASHDTTWRLWDIETGNELLLQEGHYRPVYDISFQIDGSLCASVGGDCMGRVWDLRSGNSIMLLKGHVKSILAVDFSPNGYYVATGGDDHSIRIWDLRKRKTIYTIPSHSKLVSSVKFQPSHGNFLVSSSFDRTCKIWDTRDFKLLRILAGHEEKVMCVDISSDSSTIASCGYERKWKLWKSDI